MLTRKSPKITKKSRKSNPEIHNLRFSNSQLNKISPRDLLTHIWTISDTNPYLPEDDDPFYWMDDKEKLNYIHEIVNYYNFNR